MYSSLRRNFRGVLILLILILALMAGLFLVQGSLHSAGAASPSRPHAIPQPVCSAQNIYQRSGRGRLIGCGGHKI